jgi:hypothetical protein
MEKADSLFNVQQSSARKPTPQQWQWATTIMDLEYFEADQISLEDETDVCEKASSDMPEIFADVSGVDTDPFAKPSQNESIEALGTDSTGELGGKLTQDAFNHVESLTSSQMGKF